MSMGKFYNQYKEEINEKINQIIKDFDITKQEMIKYIEAKGIHHTEDQYEFNKIWYVFSEGFGAVLSTQIFHPEYTPEQAYQDNCIIFHETIREEKAKIRKKALTRYKKNNN